MNFEPFYTVNASGRNPIHIRKKFLSAKKLCPKSLKLSIKTRTGDCFFAFREEGYWVEMGVHNKIVG